MIDLMKQDASIISQIEKICINYFNVNIQIKKIIVENMPTSNNSHTTVFMADHHALYALCTADESLNLADIKVIIKSIGMKAEAYLPPDGDSNYFLRYGQKVFQSVFPCRKTSNNAETVFYQTLTPYTPALIRIEKINGEIRQYNQNHQQWQKTLDISYLRMQVR